MQRLLTGVLVLAVASTLGCERGEAAPPAPPQPVATATPITTPGTEAAPRVVLITVGDTGYAPAKIPAKPGETLRLRFTRTTDSECVKEVMVPEQEVKKELPMNTPVDVDVKVGAKDVEFMCGMKMVKGKIVVGD